jgi:hypothetical protein
MPAATRMTTTTTTTTTIATTTIATTTMMTMLGDSADVVAEREEDRRAVSWIGPVELRSLVRLS